MRKQRADPVPPSRRIPRLESPAKDDMADFGYDKVCIRRGVRYDHSHVSATWTGGIFKPMSAPIARGDGVRLTVEPISEQPTTVASWDAIMRLQMRPIRGRPALHGTSCMNAVDTNVLVMPWIRPSPSATKAQKLLAGLAQPPVDRCSAGGGELLVAWSMESAGRIALPTLAHFRDFPSSHWCSQVHPFLTRHSTCTRVSASRTGTACCLRPAKRPGRQRCIPKTWMPGPTTTA